MKNFIILHFLIFGLISVNAQTKNEMKATLQDVALISHLIDYESLSIIKEYESLDQYCFLVATPNLHLFSDVLDGRLYSFENQQIVSLAHFVGFNLYARNLEAVVTLVPAGVHSLSVLYSDIAYVDRWNGAEIIKAGISKSASGQVSAVFEAGKFYAFDYQKNSSENSLETVSVFTIELPKDDARYKYAQVALDKLQFTKKILEDAKAYLASQSNMLEGNYIDKKFTLSKKFNIKVKFARNKYQIDGGTGIYEGVFLADDKTIILKNELHKKKSFEGIEIWYYKLSNGVFEVLSKEKVNSIYKSAGVLPIAGTPGPFNKVSE